MFNDTDTYTSGVSTATPRSDSNTLAAPCEVVDTDDGSAMDIIGFLQRHRAWFLRATLVLGLLTAALFAALLSLPPSSRSAVMEITPTFPGARAGLYPNRVPFSVQDVVSTSVVEPLWRAQGLETSVALPDLCRNLQVVAGGADLAVTRSEFMQKLANTKLTVAERSAIEAELEAKSKSLMGGSLTIILSTGGSSMTNGQMERLLGAIPTEWARASDAAGVRAYDFPLPHGKDLRASAASLTAGGHAGLTVAHAERTKEAIDVLAQSLQAMSKLPGSDGIKDASGASIVDLSQVVLATRRNMVIPAYIQAMSDAKLREPQLYAALRSTRYELLKSDLEQCTERARILRESLNDYANESRTVTHASDLAAGDARQSAVMINIDGAFIDRMIEQAVKGRDVEYRRELTDRRLEAELDVVEQTSKVQFERWLDTAVGEQQPVPMTAETSNRLAALSDLVAGYADRSQEIMRLLSERNHNSASTMFRVEAPPTIRSEPILSLRSVLLMALAAWLAIMAYGVLRCIMLDRRRYIPVRLLDVASSGSQDLREDHVVAVVGPRRVSGHV